MKRTKKIETEYILNSIRPIFYWKPCFKCDQEFTRDDGYEFLVPGANNSYITKYICNECVPTFEDAQEQYMLLMRRPPKS